MYLKRRDIFKSPLYILDNFQSPGSGCFWPKPDSHPCLKNLQKVELKALPPVHFFCSSKSFTRFFHAPLAQILVTRVPLIAAFVDDQKLINIFSVAQKAAASTPLYIRRMSVRSLIQTIFQAIKLYIHTGGFLQATLKYSTVHPPPWTFPGSYMIHAREN